MYTTERRRMSWREPKRKERLWMSAGSLWQDSLALELSSSSAASAKANISPRSRTRAVSVAYIVGEDASAPRVNSSLACLKEACADAHACLQTISFERISVGTTDILDTFYNAGKCGHAGGEENEQRRNLLRFVPADVAVVEMRDSFCQPSLFYHLAVRESFSMTNNIILYCFKQDGDLQALKVTPRLTGKKCGPPLDTFGLVCESSSGPKQQSWVIRKLQKSRKV